MSGTKNKIEDLRNHLFEVLEQLKDKEQPLEIDRARAISDVAKKIIDSAKVEVDFLRVTGQMTGSGFIPADRQLPEAAPAAFPQRRRKLAP
jgi:N-acetylglutamate synthase/N-acetylornithine aminotransferase